MGINNCFLLARLTFTGCVRDRLFLGLGVLSFILFLSTPLFSSFSLRQVVAVAVDYNLSVISLLGFFLVLFLGVNILSRDIEQRSLFTVISLPLSRTQFILSKFAGFAFLMFLIVLLLLLFSSAGILYTESIYPQDIVIHWKTIFIAAFFIYVKLMVLASVIFLFSSLGTSTIFPVSMGIAFYFIGESIEEVTVYIRGFGADKVSATVKLLVKCAEYVFLNLSNFDFKPHAIYGLAVTSGEVVNLLVSAISYISIMLAASSIIFERREFN